MRAIQVVGSDRWNIHNRLQELEIKSSCQTGQPLYAQINTPKEAILLWSVTRFNKLSRQELIGWLDYCLEQSAEKGA